jgi:hypothetical protein
MDLAAPVLDPGPMLLVEFTLPALLNNLSL